MSDLPHNKRCEFEDFADEELAGIIRDVFDPAGRHGPAYPRGREYRWQASLGIAASPAS